MAELLDTNRMLAPAFEGQRQNRWIIEWEGLDAWTAKSFARPSISFGEVPVHYINSIRYYQGKFEPQTLSLSLYDPIVPSASQKVMEWVRLSYEQLTGRAGYKEFYTARGFKLKMLDGPGAVVQQWDFINLFITAVNFGTLDYASADMAMVELTLRYDSFIMQF